MKKYLILSVTLICALLLVGCKKEPHSYNYFMTHPKALQRAVTYCLKQSNLSIDANCSVVSNALNDFEAHVSEVRNDPQGYGKKILAAQMERANLKQEIISMRSAPDIDLVKFKLLKRVYHELANKIKNMLTVVGVVEKE